MAPPPAWCSGALNASATVAAQPSRPTPEPRPILSFHAHVYYDAGTHSRGVAEALRERIGERFVVQLGRWHDVPVGPHTAAMYQVAFAPEHFATLRALADAEARRPRRAGASQHLGAARRPSSACAVARQQAAAARRRCCHCASTLPTSHRSCPTPARGSTHEGRRGYDALRTWRARTGRSKHAGLLFAFVGGQLLLPDAEPAALPPLPAATLSGTRRSAISAAASTARLLGAEAPRGAAGWRAWRCARR